MNFGENTDNWIGSFAFDSSRNTIDLTDFLSFKNGTKRPNFIQNHFEIKNTYQ
jgi:hypothetical protein